MAARSLHAARAQCGETRNWGESRSPREKGPPRARAEAWPSGRAVLPPACPGCPGRRAGPAPLTRPAPCPLSSLRSLPVTLPSYLCAPCPRVSSLLCLTWPRRLRSLLSESSPPICPLSCVWCLWPRTALSPSAFSFAVTDW